MLFRLLRKCCLPFGIIFGFILAVLIHPGMTGAVIAQQPSLWAQAIGSDLQVVRSHSTNRWQQQGRLLNQEGGDEFRRGQHEKALRTWEAAADAYEKAQDWLGSYRAQLNQAQALKELGFYPRSLAQLEEITGQLKTASSQTSLPDAQLDASQVAHLQAISLQRQGELLRRMGQLDQAQSILKEGLAIAQSIIKSDGQTEQTSAEVGKLLFSLGNVAQARENIPEAIDRYQQANAYALPQQSQVQLKLALMQAHLKEQNNSRAVKLWPNLQQQIAQLPDSHGKVYSQIKLAQCLLKLEQRDSSFVVPSKNIIQPLQTAVQTARQLGDSQAQSYALGMLGQVYEHRQAWPQAQRSTEAAIELAESRQAPKLLYQWYWQQGRIYQGQSQSEQAIASLRQSVQFLQSLRNDLVASGSETQFSFHSDIEPLYRELVSLLLKHPSSAVDSTDSAHDSERLAEAINMIDNLQKAELENYLQKACDQAQTAQVGEVDPNAAVIYPIVLDDRIEILLQLPKQPLQQFTTLIAQAEFQKTLSMYRRGLTTRSRRTFRQPGQQLYQWLIQPLEASLQRANVKTLVFVPDSRLNTVPMAALYEGDHFLVEDYRVATTPSLKLLGPKPLQTQKLSTLAAGISQSQQGFARLIHVKDELDSIQKTFPDSSILLDDGFTANAFQKQLQTLTAPIVHLATHGQFSSDAEQTYVLAWDQTIHLSKLDQFFRQASQRIELLVLSACQTAIGDEKAALGITGVAVDAGTQSTMATLWSVDDQATSILMEKFYERLSQPGVTRAEALRQSQIELLKNQQYRHPYYWAPFILVGNWL